MTICRVTSQYITIAISKFRNIYNKNMFYECQDVIRSVRSQDFSTASLVLINRRTDIWFTFQQWEIKSKSSFFNRCSDRTCTGLHDRRVGW